jgi:hypothetical protein
MILLIEHKPDSVGPPQAVAPCKRCGRLNRIALRIWAFDLSRDAYAFPANPDDPMRCYHCREIFSPDWAYEFYAEIYSWR